jgi:hypothetical protein
MIKKPTGVYELGQTHMYNVFNVAKQFSSGVILCLAFFVVVLNISIYEKRYLTNQNVVYWLFTSKNDFDIKTSDGYYTTSNTTFKTEKHSKHTNTGNRIKKDAKNTKNKQNICTKTQTFINLYCFKHTSNSQCQS